MDGVGRVGKWGVGLQDDSAEQWEAVPASRTKYSRKKAVVRNQQSAVERAHRSSVLVLSDSYLTVALGKAFSFSSLYFLHL